MARVVLVVDSDTGALVDVAGNDRENARYSRFAKRMLSLARNPVLDYGANGGDTLTIAKGNDNGAAINLKADVVNVFGTLKVGNRTIGDVISDQTAGMLSTIKGTPGEISVTSETDQETGKTYTVISIDSSITTRINGLENLLTGEDGILNSYVSKDSLANAIDGIVISDDDDLDGVKAQLQLLLSRLSELVSGGSSGSPAGE